METKYNYENQEIEFQFLMNLEGMTCKIEAFADVDEIMTEENIFRGTEKPEYIDVYKANVFCAKTERKLFSISANPTKEQDVILRAISDKLTERLIKNASRTWFATDAPRLFREEFDKALEHRHDLTL